MRFLIPLLIWTCAWAKESIEPSCNEGNFAIRSSQQPGPLLSLGDNIIEQGDTQVQLLTTYSRGQKKSSTKMQPSLLYGINNETSVMVGIPYAIKNKEAHSQSAGIGDLFAVLEYAYINKPGSCSTHEATVLGGLTFPTGSDKKNPSTGTGSVSFLGGLTYDYTGKEWFSFMFYGAFVPTEHHQTRAGTELLYEFGFGKTFLPVKKWLLAWLIEIDGTYAFKNKTKGRRDPNSGGNIILVTPSLWLSSNQFIFQLGVSIVTFQHLNGQQGRSRYQIAGNIAYTF